MTDYQPYDYSTPPSPPPPGAHAAPEYYAPPAPPSWSPPPPAAPRKRNRLLAAAAAVVLVGAGVGIGYAIPHGHSASASGGKPASKSGGAKTLYVLGTLSLSDPGALLTWTGTTGGACAGEGGYSDIAGGAQVIVSDDAGVTLALTQLSDGVFSTTTSTCNFSFTTSVPAGKAFYGVEVTHRGVIKETPASLGIIALTLGG